MPTETSLLQEVSEVLAEFFGEDAIPSRTDAAVAEGRCRLIEDDELANTLGDTVQGAASSPSQVTT